MQGGAQHPVGGGGESHPALTLCLILTGEDRAFMIEMIERGGKVGFPIFIDNIHANAIGYNILYKSEVAANAK